MGRGQGFILAGASEEIRLVALFRTEVGDIRAPAPQIQKHRGFQKPTAINGGYRSLRPDELIRLSLFAAAQASFARSAAGFRKGDVIHNQGSMRG